VCIRLWLLLMLLLVIIMVWVDSLNCFILMCDDVCLCGWLFGLSMVLWMLVIVLLVVISLLIWCWGVRCISFCVIFLCICCLKGFMILGFVFYVMWNCGMELFGLLVR